MSAMTEHLDVILTGPAARIPIPVWMRPYSPKTVAGNDVKALPRLPELTVVQVEEPSTVLRRTAFLSSLAAQHERTPGPSKILFVFKAKKLTVDAKKLSAVLVFFSRFTDVEFALGADQAAFALQGAVAKSLVAIRVGQSTHTLGSLTNVITATSALRAKSGRLSAQKIAALFSLSVAELAKLLGKSRQAVSKTDDAESIQEGLAPFDRTARLRTVLSEEDFRSWLHLSHELLDGCSPWALIRSGKIETVAELAEDMLSGNPA